MNQVWIRGLRYSVAQAFLIAIIGTGCSVTLPNSPLYVNDSEYQQTWLPFLQDGKTTKSEVESKVGKAPRQFDGGRIWTYGMVGVWVVNENPEYSSLEQWHKEKYPGQPVWVVNENPEYSLVLVFDENNVLRKHSLVKLRHKQMSG